MKLMSGLAILLASLAFSANALDLAKIAALKKQVDENEPKQLWKKVNWQSDMKAALKTAQKEKKPVMTFMLVNEGGKADAARC